MAFFVGGRWGWKDLEKEMVFSDTFFDLKGDINISLLVW